MADEIALLKKRIAALEDARDRVRALCAHADPSRTLPPEIAVHFKGSLAVADVLAALEEARET